MPHAPDPRPDAAAWSARAADLAAWALARYHAHPAAHGAYVANAGGKPKAVTRKLPLNAALLEGHFRAAGPARVVAAHSLDPADDCGVLAALDVDAHPGPGGGPDADPAANRRLAEGVARELAGLGFRPLCYSSNGLGGYHVVAFFDRKVPGGLLQRFARWLGRDHARYGVAGRPESFPKQAAVAGGFGNFLRVVGRHYDRAHWPEVFDGESWLAGAAAVAHVLTLTGDPPDLVPAEALADGETGEGPRPRAEDGGSRRPGDAFNAQGVAAARRLLEGHGWRLHRERAAGVSEWTRPGKGVGDGLSGTLGHCRRDDGVPLFYCWTSNAPPLAAGACYTPFALLAALEHGGDFRAAAAALGGGGAGPGPGPVSARGPAAAAARRLVTRPASEVAPEEVCWLWEGRIPLGMLSEILGDPGCGKSTITADLAAAVSTGRPLPGGGPTPPAAVLFLSAEDSAAHTIRPRLEAAGADLRLVHLLFHVEAGGKQLPLTLPDHFDLVEAAVREHAVQLIVVDPLNAFLAARVEANDDKDVRSAIMYPLRELAEATGAAVVLVRHLNKGGGKAVYRGGGSIGFTGAVRASLAAGKTDDGRRVLVCNKMNVAAEPPGVEYELVRGEGAATVRWGGEVALTADELFDMRPGPPAEEAGPRAAAAEFLAAALADGPRRATELRSEAEAAGISETTLKRAAADLPVLKVKTGYGKGAFWEWFLPSPPREFVPVDPRWRDNLMAALAEIGPGVGEDARALAARLEAAGTPVPGVVLVGFLGIFEREGLIAHHAPVGPGLPTWSLPDGPPPAEPSGGLPADGGGLGAEGGHPAEGGQPEPSPPGDPLRDAAEGATRPPSRKPRKSAKKASPVPPPPP